MRKKQNKIVNKSKTRTIFKYKTFILYFSWCSYCMENKDPNILLYIFMYK